MLKFFGTMLALTLASASYGSEIVNRDPVGEFADYTVDRNSSRTTGMIQRGVLKAAVTTFQPDHSDGPSYEVKIDYTFKIQFLGVRTGTELVSVPDVYFTPEFLADLRVNGEYISDSFKVQHLGFADVRTMDGGVYPNCDKIRIYDIKQEGLGIIGIARQMLTFSNDPTTASDFENMEILAHVKEGLPVLGAAKIDVSGIYQGMNVKAGSDYDRP